MADIDSAKQALLYQFGKALNSNDVVRGNAFVTDDFIWIYYEGPDRPEGRIIRGFKAACEAVVERANRLKTPIVFSESTEYASDDKNFYDLQGQGRIYRHRPLRRPGHRYLFVPQR